MGVEPGERIGPARTWSGPKSSGTARIAKMDKIQPVGAGRGLVQTGTTDRRGNFYFFQKVSKIFKNFKK